jgi:hypothetical protein
MDFLRWQPICPFPDDLVWPVRVDPRGVAGPTRGQTQGARWRRSGQGWWVPTETDSTVVEQRILEQAVRITSWGAVTGWAALRWRGAAYFDGLAQGGRVELMVPLLRTSGFSTETRAALGRSQLSHTEREVVRGIWCTTIQRALFDDMRFLGLRRAVVSMEMAAAAGLISTALMTQYVAQRGPWTGIPLVRRALRLAGDHSRSPQETLMKLVWVLDAGLAYPLVNPPVFDLAGNLLGYPDLFDPVAGLAGEYDGIDHKSRERHQRDVAREQRYRDHGLEYLTVVGGDLQDRELVVKRMLWTRQRALFAAPEDRLWTLTPPPWWPLPEPLDARLRRLGLAPALTHI